VTVPPENATVADSRGRFGSGGAYAVGHELALVEVAAGVRRGLALGAVLGLGPTVAVAVSDGDAESVASGPSAPVEALHAARSAATTTHEVRTYRR
jgi:hypothetical protein